MFSAYINSLKLKRGDGSPLTADNYPDFLRSEIIRSAQIAKNAGADIPDSIGFSFNSSARGMFSPPRKWHTDRKRQTTRTWHTPQCEAGKGHEGDG